MGVSPVFRLSKNPFGAFRQVFAVCRAHNLSPHGGQIPHLQPVKYVPPGTRPGGTWFLNYFTPNTGKETVLFDTLKTGETHGVSPVLFSGSLSQSAILPPSLPDIEHHVQYNAADGGRRSRKADLRQAGIRLDAHDVSQRQPHQQGLNQSLNHHPQGLPMAVEVAHHTEHHRRDNGLQREALQIC